MPSPDEPKEESRAEHDLLAAVFENMADAAIIACGPDLRVVLANRAFRALAGGREAVGKTALEAWPELPLFGDRLREVLQTGAPFHVVDDELQLRRQPGAPFETAYFTWSISRVQLPRGEGWAALVTARETTDKLHAEEARRESEERFRLLAEALPVLVTVTRRSDGTVFYVNEAFERAIGIPRAELVGRRSPDFYFDPAERLALRDTIAEKGSARDVELRFKRADGTPFWVSGSVTPILYGGELAYVGSAIDITARKEVEQALQQSESALREASGRKDEFLAMLSHELRNPLAAIRSAVHVLGKAPVGSDARRRAQGVLERQTALLARMVDDLLDVSRIARNKIRLLCERTSLTALVRSAIEDHRGTFAGQEVELTENLATDPMWLDGDPPRLSQLISNVLNNALKFTPAGGRVDVSLAREQDVAILRIRDTGIGIPREELPKLFEPFTQIERTLARSRGGLGLGLALVKGVAELHGGSASVASEGLGHGAELTVRLPLAPAAIARADEAAHRQGARRRVLVIEDNQDSGEMLELALVMMGHEVRLAGDGPSGITVAKEFHPDVVLCDIGLPGMDGYEVARRLRADDSLRAAVLVALTGYGQPEDRQRAEERGFDHHLTKPASVDALQAILAGTNTPPEEPRMQ